MEHYLNSKDVFPFHSVAASMGGKHDRGTELTEKGRAEILRAIEGTGLPCLKLPTYVKTSTAA